VADRIACLPGDGIGPEVTSQALRVLAELPVDVDVVELPFGGSAIDETGEPLPEETLSACRESQAVLLGAVGGPKWDGGARRPEEGLLGLRQALDVYANLRPATAGDVDLLVVRELIGGIYFGPRGVRDDGTVFDTCEYHPTQVARIVRRAFELAESRRSSLVSVDKANVLDTSRLWRRVVDEVAPDHPGVQLRHALVDSFAIEIALHADRLDVVVTENMFGDILSDLASGVVGGLGLAASASLGDAAPGIVEPIHGSAPDIAGQSKANPLAAIMSVAMLLEHSAKRPDLAAAVNGAVEDVLDGGARTADIARRGETVLSTRQMGDAVLQEVERRLS
jgi:3-isopropylmalate dehydrogenase